jgi:threonine aldolase
MRQVGILAAAGLYALQNNIPRLKEDHEKACMLASAISKNPNLEIDMNTVQTNILAFRPKNISVEPSLEKLAQKGLILSSGKVGFLRAVTHLDVSFEEIEQAIKILEEVFNK